MVRFTIEYYTSDENDRDHDAVYGVEELAKFTKSHKLRTRDIIDVTVADMSITDAVYILHHATELDDAIGYRHAVDLQYEASSKIMGAMSDMVDDALLNWVASIRNDNLTTNMAIIDSFLGFLKGEYGKEQA